MLARIRTHFGTAGLVVAIVALIAALGGGAYAATGATGGGKASASAKAKKGPRGPKGPKGDTGPAGPQGPAGAKGDKGDKGDAGAPGAPGATGPAGPAGPAGAKGATGATGPAGQTGFTKTLPSGESLYGAWTFDAPGGNKISPSAISFGIPLAEAPAVLFVPKDGPPTEAEKEECPGTVTEPAASEGVLCVYTELLNGEFQGLISASAGGASLLFISPPGTDSVGLGYGTWAVTAN